MLILCLGASGSTETADLQASITLQQATDLFQWRQSCKYATMTQLQAATGLKLHNVQEMG